MFWKKKCSYKVRKFHRKRPALKSNFIKVKLQDWCFPVKFAIFLKNILKNIWEILLLYFHCNSHHYYHHRHFHNNCKMHLYRLKVLLTIPLNCNMIPCLFQLNFVFFLQAFCFLRPVKKLRIHLRPPEKFYMFS